MLNIRAPQGSVVSPLLFTLYTHDCTPRHQENSIPQSPARLRKILGPYPRQLFRQSTRNNSVWKHHKVVCFVRCPRLKVSAWEYHWYRPQSISAIDGVRCLHRAQRILTTTTPSTVCSKDTVPGDSYYSSTYSHTHTFFFFFFLTHTLLAWRDLNSFSFLFFATLVLLKIHQPFTLAITYWQTENLGFAELFPLRCHGWSLDIHYNLPNAPCLTGPWKWHME